MAYNPFNIFRRNQKVIFAVLTVFIMIMFTLSSGVIGGDFFEWIPRWLGAKSKKGDVLCTLDGQKLYSADLTAPGRGAVYFRRLANRYMTEAAVLSADAVQQAAQEQIKTLDPELRRVIMQGPQIEQQLNNPQFQMMRQIFPPEQLAKMEGTVAAYHRLLVDESAPQPAKEAVRLQQVLQILGAQAQLARGGHYFVNLPNTTDKDAIEFMLWQKKADQLGIRFTDADVARLLASEFYGFFRPELQVHVKQDLTKAIAGFSMTDCLRGITEEFRVRMAQQLVLGPVVGPLDPETARMLFPRRGDRMLAAPPQFTMPYEMFEHYRNESSPTTYEVIAVPVANFISRVPNPDDQNPAVRDELQKLFDQYKDDEPNPKKETPGFKEPRKVKLQWVSATGNEPYYQKLAAEKQAQEEILARVRPLMTAPALPPVPGVVADVARPFVVDPIVGEEYARRVDNHTADVNLYWMSASPSTANHVLDTSVVRAPNLAAATGGFGAAAGLAGPFPGVLALESGSVAFEQRDRVRVGVTAFLAAVPGPGMLNTVSQGEVAVRTLTPKPLSLETLKPELLKVAAERRAKSLLADDMKKFMEEVAKRSENGKAKDKGAVQKYIADTAAARGWQIGASTGLDDEWSVEEDPGLAPVRAALPKSVHGDLPVRFGEKFFWNTESRGSRVPALGTYKPEYYPNAPRNPEFESPFARPEPRFLVWRTEEVPAKPVGLEEAMPHVKAAWKRIKARDLAKERAEAIATAARNAPGDSPEVIHQSLQELVFALKTDAGSDLKAQDRVKQFYISGVCPIPLGGINPFLPQRRDGLPEELRPTADMPYPTKEMAKALLEERTKPPKTSFVQPDQPKDLFYVITLVRRDMKSDLQFSLDSTPSSPNHEGVVRPYAMDDWKKTRESILILLQREFKYEATEEQKKKLDENEKRGNANND